MHLFAETLYCASALTISAVFCKRPENMHIVTTDEK